MSLETVIIMEFKTTIRSYLTIFVHTVFLILQKDYKSHVSLSLIWLKGLNYQVFLIF